MNLKSEKLKKLESELNDLEQWLRLGLVPKKETEKHKEEIKLIKEKIKDEKEKLRLLKENGDIEEYVAPKRTAGKQVYAEPQTLPGMDMASSGLTETGFDMETETSATSSDSSTTQEMTIIEETEEDYFSDKSRWKRGVFEDPDSDNW